MAPGKGILAADESTGTIARRFDGIGAESTEDEPSAITARCCFALQVFPSSSAELFCTTRPSGKKATTVRPL